MFGFLAGLFGCDRVGELKPGESTGFDVRDRMGTPTMEWKNPDGSVTWEYPRGPAGKVTYMVTIGPDSLLRTVDQVLTEPYFARVRNGMTHDEVRRLLGRPGQTNFFPLKQEEVWDWRVEGQMPTDKAHFHVHFDTAGQVVGTSRGVEPGP